MGKQLDAKSAILIVVIAVLIGAAAYLTYLIQDGSNPLVILFSQASEEDGFVDDGEFLALAPRDAAGGPTPTIAYSSTSPTPAGSGIGDTFPPQATLAPTAAAGSAAQPTPSPTPTKTPTPSPTPAQLPITGGGNDDPTPTPIQQLPVAGVEDYVKPAVFGGVILILGALLL